MSDAIEQHFPYDGPHDAEAITAVASAVADLVRYLNNASFSPARLPWAAQNYRVLSNLSDATHGLAQLLGELRRVAEQHAKDPTTYDDRRDRPGRDTATQLAELIGQARTNLDPLAASLTAAADLASHLGNDD